MELHISWYNAILIGEQHTLTYFVVGGVQLVAVVAGGPLYDPPNG